jgi:CMP-N-acetylneuraminic acid synthetase
VTLFLIPARAGSKRLKNKNRLPFCGLPLWLWSYATAMRVKSEGDEVMVSTDDREILEVAKALGPHAQFRPDYLCRDDSTSQSLIDWTFAIRPSVDSICLLQPTSPTRRDDAVRKLISLGVQARTINEKTGEPDGNVYVYKREGGGWFGVPLTTSADDIDTAEQFSEAERKQLAWAFQ